MSKPNKRQVATCFLEDREAITLDPWIQAYKTCWKQWVRAAEQHLRNSAGASCAEDADLLVSRAFEKRSRARDGSPLPQTAAEASIWVLRRVELDCRDAQRKHSRRLKLSAGVPGTAIRSNNPDESGAFLCYGTDQMQPDEQADALDRLRLIAKKLKQGFGRGVTRLVDELLLEDLLSGRDSIPEELANRLLTRFGADCCLPTIIRRRSLFCQRFWEIERALDSHAEHWVRAS